MSDAQMVQFLKTSGGDIVAEDQNELVYMGAWVRAIDRESIRREVERQNAIRKENGEVTLSLSEWLRRAVAEKYENDTGDTLEGAQIRWGKQLDS